MCRPRPLREGLLPLMPPVDVSGTHTIVPLTSVPLVALVRDTQRRVDSELSAR